MVTNYKLNRISVLAGLLFFTFTSNQAMAMGAAICSQTDSDPDGDGWGWENNQTCVVDMPNGTLLEEAVTAPILSTSGIRVCASSASDLDRDGWGWEGGQSCQVSIADSIPAASESVLSANDGSILYCADSSSDLDNDGWGWEAGRSCRVANPVTGLTDKVVASVQPGVVPFCSSSHIDENNDGWGWEQNASCIIQSSSRSLQRVLAVGDSITHGVRGQTSYRKPLNSLLSQSDCSYEFVGSQISNSGHDGFISPHEGYSGHTADHFLFGRTDGSGVNQGIAQSMASFDPDVVLLHIGSNDMRLGQNIDNTISEIDQIISTIHQSNSSAVVLVANVIPWYASAVQAAVVALGGRIEAYVTQRSNPLIQLVDVRSGFAPDMMIWDGVHPNEVGEAHIADAFFDIYQRSGLCTI